MTREYLNVPFARQSDPGWVTLSILAQLLYGYTIPSDRYVDWAGVVPIRTACWANTACDLSVPAVESALTELAARRWVVLDRDTDEMWLRTFMADQHVLRSPGILRRAMVDATECRSVVIRQEIVKLLDREVPDRERHPSSVIGRKPRPPIPTDLRLDVYERDDWTCQDCGRRIPPQSAQEAAGLRAPYDETGWLALDHIIPWSMHGPDDYVNLRALCTPCNSRKGAQVEQV